MNPASASSGGRIRHGGIRHSTFIVAVNLVVFLLLAELVSLGAYAWETGALYYTDDTTRPSPDSSERLDKHRIHPYFGYAWKPDEPTEPPRNNHGFVSRVDYPFTTEETVIGIFGGSLAANLAVYEAEQSVLRTRLAEKLGRPVDDFRVLNFAQAGYKQPQQLLLATYFRALGQRLDLAINVDGFNELTLGTTNAMSGWHLAVPSMSHIGPLRDVVGFTGSTTEGFLRMAKIRGSWDAFTYRHERAWSRTGWETRTASGFLFNWLLCKFHLRSYQATFTEHTNALESDGESKSWLYLEAVPPVSEDDEAGIREIMDWAVAFWSRANRDFHRLQTAAGDGYLHVLQPNQYYATERVFSAEEQAIAFSDDSPFGPFVPPGYPRLEAAIDELREDGVHAWSATRLFDDVAEPVYRDNCCHLNDLGHRLLAEKLADLAAQELSTETLAETRPDD